MACTLCRSNSLGEFTIHGLWPDYNDETWPACCSRSHFEEKEISSLVDTLKKYWPSLSCSSTSTCYGGKGSFWAHEWGNISNSQMLIQLSASSEKHGTCSSPVFRDEHEYFLATINLYSKYNVTSFV
ncbi:hypothetical protein MLD38_028254 [Melastoma candidum]|uniref:Uncharacterized protein n=1 Tax=Melastoma candidum TaxID=119954 RepID=A0ACB9N4T4_9MYRT|nr:hypothetical protein MLD38_028254 [Melastoma candidum]